MSIMDFDGSEDRIRIEGHGITDFDSLMDLANDHGRYIAFDFGGGDSLRFHQTELADLAADQFEFIA